MQLPLQISFRHMERSSALEATIRERAGKLDKFAERIMSCRVVVAPMGKHHRRGNQYGVRLDITLPSGEVVSSREPRQHTQYMEIGVAIRDAFDSAVRQLEDFLRIQRGATKAHHPLPHARVSALMPGEKHGFLLAPDGREVYFHRNSVLNNAFDQLVVGTEVAFVEEEGHSGPQASTVRLVGRHGGV